MNDRIAAQRLNCSSPARAGRLTFPAAQQIRGSGSSAAAKAQRLEAALERAGRQQPLVGGRTGGRALELIRFEAHLRRRVPLRPSAEHPGSLKTWPSADANWAAARRHLSMANCWSAAAR